MTRLATTITIPVASAAKQENSTRSLRRKGMLNASPSPPLCTAHFDTPRFGLTFDARLRSHQELLRLLPALGHGGRDADRTYNQASRSDQPTRGLAPFARAFEKKVALSRLPRIAREHYRLADEKRETILVACSKCDWRAAFSRDDLIASHGAGLRDAQPTQPSRRAELQQARLQLGSVRCALSS